MQIFILDEDIKESVHMYADAHVVKIPLECVQLLSTCTQRYLQVEGLYKPVYQNHPWTNWVGRNSANFAWTLDMARELFAEYTYRFDRVHKSQGVLDRIIQLYPQLYHYLETSAVCTPKPNCVTPEFKYMNNVDAYRNYYLLRKQRVFKWTGRPIPEWIKESL